VQGEKGSDISSQDKNKKRGKKGLGKKRGREIYISIGV